MFIKEAEKCFLATMCMLFLLWNVLKGVSHVFVILVGLDGVFICFLQKFNFYKEAH